MFRYDRLDQLVFETGKKKNYLSQKIGHSGRYLNDARKQGTNIKIEEVQILAKELGTTVEYLIGETDIKEAPRTNSAESHLDEQLVNRLIVLTPAELEKVDAFVQGLLAARSI